MIEYLYNAIRCTAGQYVGITSIITDEQGFDIKEDCKLMLHSNTEMLGTVDGVYKENEGFWEFLIPAELTKGLKGRHWYCICHKDSNLCFKEPIYFV